MKITDEAVRAATEQLNINDMTLYDSHAKRQEAMVRRMINAALPHLRTGYKVKKLEWKRDKYGEIEFTAQSIFGEYSVFIKRKSAYACSLDGVTYDRINFNPPYTLDKAKAAAQADFESRVSECIDGNLPNEGAKMDAKELIQALSRLAGNRHSDGISSLVNADDRNTIINTCHDLIVALKTFDTFDVVEVRNVVEKLIKAADEVVFHFGDSDNGFSIPSVNEADYICTSLGSYHEARAKLVSLIGALSAVATEEEEK